MLRIAEQWADSNLGLQRQGNEDNYFVRAPLFVVADGMGGAQSGEVASEMAVAAFDRGLPNGTSPADGLVAIIEGANRAINERSRNEQQRAGMGTTVTAAYVGEQTVTVAHVGDSRCYLIRDGELTQLTDDHSLVWELVKRGKLTEEQAESHPQRSVITRALGPEPSVQVDVQEYEARAGDVFLVCSDGLTSMVQKAKLEPLLADPSRPLNELGPELIGAANAAGGRDNITVVLFRLEEVPATGGKAPAAEDGAELAGDTHEYSTFTGEAVPDPRQGVSRPQEESSGRATDEQEASYRASGTVALAAVRPRAQPIEEARPHGPPPGAPPAKRRRRRLVTPGRILFLGAVAGVLLALWLATREVYFVGVDEQRGNVVTVYQGLPYDLPLGVRLYSPVASSGVTLDTVPPARRRTFTDHKLRQRKDAESLVLAAEQGRIR
jgi:serine/threonine protein phosphatase PrpC